MISDTRQQLINKKDTLLSNEEKLKLHGEMSELLKPVLDILVSKNYISSYLDEKEEHIKIEIYYAALDLYCILKMNQFNNQHDHLFHCFNESSIYEVFGENFDLGTEENKKNFVSSLMKDLL